MAASEGEPADGRPRGVSEPEESFCGNSLVEEGEQCDAGLIGSEDSDPCCDEECRLKPNAKCRYVELPLSPGWIGLSAYGTNSQRCGQPCVFLSFFF